MNIGGRYVRVRAWTPGDSIEEPSYYHPPFILDRWRKCFLPAMGPEWWRTPEGVYLPMATVSRAERLRAMLLNQRGSIGFQRAYTTLGLVLNFWQSVNSSSGQNTINLDSNYSKGSSGDSFGMRFYPLHAETLSEVYFYISAFGGTASSVNDLDLELWPSTTDTIPDVSGTKLDGVVGYNPASTTGWHRTTGWSYSMSVATPYWLVVGDPDGTTDYARGVVSMFNALNSAVDKYTSTMPATTADGWQTATLSGGSGTIVALFSSGRTVGTSLAQGSTSVTSALQKGLLISAGIKGPLDIYAVVFNLAGGDLTGIKIWYGATGPTGTAAHTSTRVFRDLTVSGANPRGVLIDDTGLPAGRHGIRLPAGMPISICSTVGASSAAGPAKHRIGTGADATLRAAMPGGGNEYWREEAAGSPNDWSSDDVNAYPGMALFIDDPSPQSPRPSSYLGI